jgi:hypothetical protein
MWALPRVTKAKQLSIMRADTTEKRPPCTHRKGTRFTLGITRTKLPSL